MTALGGWESFYVIVGSSAGALIGLQFVVLTLIAEAPLGREDARAGAAFATPTLVHFGAVLVVSAILSAPWEGIAAAAALWGMVGVGGVAYSIVVARRLRSQTAYKPVFEDWLFYLLLPLVAYAMLGAASCAAWSSARPALFVVAAAALLLLLVGIHNAWDMVMYNVFVRRRERIKDEKER
jgi:hypothetical protein